MANHEAEQKPQATNEIHHDPRWRESIESYLEIMQAATHGPQREGYAEYDLDKIFTDRKTPFILYGDKVAWPIITPIENTTEYLAEYFDDYRSYAQGRYYYLAMPAFEILEADPNFTSTIIRTVRHALQQDRRLVFEESPGRDIIDFLLTHGLDENEFNIDTFVDKRNDTDAAVRHFEGLTNVGMTNEHGELHRLRDAYPLVDPEYAEIHNGTILLDPFRLSERLPGTDKTVTERLWEIYDGQFSKLVQQNPSRQAQTYDEVKKMTEDPETLTVAHLVDGDVVSFGMFVGNIEACDWLNTNFYTERFGRDNILYFPGIATDLKKEGNKYAFSLIDLIAKLISKSGIDRHIVFQCTNISADYIPRIVEQYTEATGFATIKIEEYWRYNYLSIQRAGSYIPS